MAIISNIPKSVAEGFEKLNKLEESSFGDIINALKDTDVAVHPGRLAEKILLKIKNVDLVTLQDIFGATTTLINYQENEDFTLAELVDDVIRLVNEEKAEGIKLKDQKETKTFKERLLILLESETLVLSQKSSNAYYDYDKLFTNVEINTGIRPIFTDGRPQYAVLSAELHLEYRCELESRDLYLGIDREDIQKLKKEIERAEKRIKIIEDMIEKSGMKELRIEKEIQR